MKFPNLRINNEIIDINLDFFENLATLILKTEKSQRYILLEDTYYNSFFDNEISLFWFFFKTYLSFKNLESNSCTNFDCLHIIFDKNLTKNNKPHVLSFVHNNDIDFFTNLKNINPEKRQILITESINLKTKHKNFISYINNCGPGSYWKFTEKNIEKLLNTSIENNLDSNNLKEKIFLAKNIIQYCKKEISHDCFYYWYCDSCKIDDETLSFKSDFLKFLKKRIEVLNSGIYGNDKLMNLLIFIEINNKENLISLNNFLKDEQISKLLYKSLYKFIIFYKGKPIKYPDYLVSTINSSLKFKDKNLQNKHFIIENNYASFILSCLKKQIKNTDDILYKQKFQQIKHLIFKFLFLGNIRFSKLEKLVNDFLKFNDSLLISKVNEQLIELKNNVEKSNNIFSIEEELLSYINVQNSKHIFIAKSNFCLKNEDLEEFIIYLKSILNNDVSIIELNKSYPLELDNDSLLIYLGSDSVSKFFNKKINLIQINLDYQLDDNDIEFLNDFDSASQLYFCLKYDKSSEIILSNKKLLYYNNLYEEIYIDTVKNIYENEVNNSSICILSDFSLIRNYSQKFIENYTKNSQTRKIIKNNSLKRKYNGQKTILWENKKEYYNFLANKFLENIENSSKYSNLIFNNLSFWIEKNNLPRDKYIFIKFLEFINLGSEAHSLYQSHRNETSLNQNSGREVIKQLEAIFEKDWENNIDYKELIYDLKKSKLFKKATIEYKGNINE